MPAVLPGGAGTARPTAQPALYEQEQMQTATGGALHPGGLHLTRLLLESSRLQPAAHLLDIGCGCGASLGWLKEQQFQTTGIDLSLPLLRRAVENQLDVVQGQALDMPFPNAAFAGVLCECSLSLITQNGGGAPDLYTDRLEEALHECRRLLRPGGWLLISDVYARRPEGVPALREMASLTCLRGALDLSELQSLLIKVRFKIERWEDHSQAVRQITSQLCQGYGSLQNFWEHAVGAPLDTFDIALRIGRARPGYFILVAQKID